MSYKLITSPIFKKEAKQLTKKYASLKTEINKLGLLLMDDPTMGTPLGNNVYKIRLSIASKNKGKSGGARVISLVKVIDETIYLLSIYSKGAKNNVSDAEIDTFLEDYE